MRFDKTHRQSTKAMSNNVELLNMKQIYFLPIMVHNINVLRGKPISYRGTANGLRAQVKSTCIESVFHFGGYKEQRQRGGAAFFLFV